MRLIRAFLLAMPLIFSTMAFAGDAEVKAAQGTIEAQLKPSRRRRRTRLFLRRAQHQSGFSRPSSFMGMVEAATSRSQATQLFVRQGPGDERDPIVQQVMIIGPDGKDYEAVYTLELQPDGTYRITGVSLKASNSLST